MTPGQIFLMNKGHKHFYIYNLMERIRSRQKCTSSDMRIHVLRRLEGVSGRVGHHVELQVVSCERDLKETSRINNIND